MTEERWARTAGGGVGEDARWRGRRGRRVERLGEDGGGRGGGEDDSLSAGVILGLDPRICLTPAPGVVAAAADPRLKGEDDGGEVGARMTEERWGRGRRRRGRGEDDGLRGWGEDDTLSAGVILGLDPRICHPPAPDVVAAAADPRLRGEDDGGEVGARMTEERWARTAGGEGGSEEDGGEAGARTTPSPQASSSGLTRGSASRLLRALSPPPQILASRARMTEERLGRGLRGERLGRG